MVGGIRQHFAAVVAFGVADDRLPPEFSNLAAAPHLLHTDRVDMTAMMKSIADRFIGCHFKCVIANAVDVTLSRCDARREA